MVVTASGHRGRRALIVVVVAYKIEVESATILLLQAVVRNAQDLVVVEILDNALSMHVLYFVSIKVKKNFTLKKI